MSEPISGGTNGTDPLFEWYKQEHETLAKHFEETWKSGALNFSYAAIVSAALLTLGSTRLQLGVAMLLAIAPIGAWLALTYFTYSRYTVNLGNRLKEIETTVCQRYGVSSGHFTQWYECHRQGKTPRVYIGVFLFIGIWLILGVVVLWAEASDVKVITDAIVAPKTPFKLEIVDSDQKPHIALQGSDDVENWNKRFQDMESQIAALQQRMEAIEVEFKASGSATSSQAVKGKKKSP